MKNKYIFIIMIIMLFSPVRAAETNKITESTNGLAVQYLYDGKELGWDWGWAAPQIEPVIKGCPAAMDSLRNARIARIAMFVFDIPALYFAVDDLVLVLHKGQPNYICLPLVLLGVASSILQTTFIYDAIDKYNYTCSNITSENPMDINKHDKSIAGLTLLEARF